MGQQQLLLLVLGMFIVGMAVYFGIFLLEDKTRRLHADLLTSYAIQVSSQATIWRSKESPYLGGGGSYEDLNIDGMEVLALSEDWPPGLVRITYASEDSLVITAISKYYADVGVRVHVSDVHIVQTNIAFDGSITFPE
jgi:hypothetical protein